jgi:glyoxylase-like metal-dependent hydrolase (beta-lactamase superfamily II)
MQRRKFLSSTTALIGTFPLIPLNQFNFLTKMYPLEDDVVKIKIGKFDCTIFRDYIFKYLAKDFFINADPEELNTALKKYHLNPNNIASPFIAVLLQFDERKVFIDTGIGFSNEPLVFRGESYVFKGRVQQLLQTENLKKEEITDVIITHFHPDHIGGIFTDDKKLNAPNAQFHMHEDEWSYWHSSLSDNQPPLFKYFIEKNINNLKSSNLHLFKGESVDVAPGITALKAEGHTPGQIALDIHSDNEHLLYISDAFLNPVHIERLDWQTNYDLDHEKAKETRIKLLELAYKENMQLIAFHFDFPGLGRIDKFQNNWKWNYSEKKT